MHNKLSDYIIYLTTHPKRNKHKYLYFLISIVLLMSLIPLLEGDKYSAALLNSLTTIIILTGVYAVSVTKQHIIIACICGLPWVIINWSIFALKMVIPGSAVIGMGVLFFVYTTAVVFLHVIKGTKVTIETLYGAVSVYLLIGLTYTSIYGVLEIINPGSFNMLNSEEIIYPFKIYELFYFSYTTLTTLGYGDIRPISAIARSFAISEAIIGQLYLTILVARLVGLHISAFRRSE